jgi:hypothetical protein
MLSSEVKPHLRINPVHPFVVPSVVEFTQTTVHHPESPPVVYLGELRKALPYQMVLIGLWFVVKNRWVNGKHLQGLTSADAMFLGGVCCQFSFLGRP